MSLGGAEQTLPEAALVEHAAQTEYRGEGANRGQAERKEHMAIVRWGSGGLDRHAAGGRSAGVVGRFIG